jgi:hypothetical protein
LRNAYKIFVVKLEEKRPVARPRHRWEDIWMILEKQGGKVWTGFNWLRIGSNGILFWTWWSTFRFHKRHRISWLPKWVLASQGLCSTESVKAECSPHDPWWS